MKHRLMGTFGSGFRIVLCFTVRFLHGSEGLLGTFRRRAPACIKGKAVNIEAVMSLTGSGKLDLSKGNVLKVLDCFLESTVLELCCTLLAEALE